MIRAARRQPAAPYQPTVPRNRRLRVPDAPWPTGATAAPTRPHQPTRAERLCERVWEIHDAGMALVWMLAGAVVMLASVAATVAIFLSFFG